MKRPFTTIVFVLFAYICVAQDSETYYDYISLTYDDTQNIEFTSTLVNGMIFKEYISQNGQMVQVGDRLIVNKPSTNATSFTYLYMGRVTIGKVLLSPPMALAAGQQGEEIIVEKITISHTKMSRKSPVGVIVHCINKSAPDIANGRTILDLEKALTYGEIINPNAPMTREEAIAKLKESKELLDLGIISQTKYDSLKRVLTPIILAND